MYIILLPDKMEEDNPAVVEDGQRDGVSPKKV
jgi:hypothetical protein